MDASVVIEYDVPILDLYDVERQISVQHEPPATAAVVASQTAGVEIVRSNKETSVACEIATVRWHSFGQDAPGTGVWNRVYLRGVCDARLIPVPAPYMQRVLALLKRDNLCAVYVWILHVL